MKKMSLRLVFIEMISKRIFSWTYATQYIQICIYILKASKFETFLRVKGERLNRGAGCGLEIPVIYTFNGHEKAIEWIKSKIQEDIKLEQSMKNRCLK